MLMDTKVFEFFWVWYEEYQPYLFLGPASKTPEEWRLDCITAMKNSGQTYLDNNPLSDGNRFRQFNCPDWMEEYAVPELERMGYTLIKTVKYGLWVGYIFGDTHYSNRPMLKAEDEDCNETGNNPGICEEPKCLADLVGAELLQKMIELNYLYDKQRAKEDTEKHREEFNKCAAKWKEDNLVVSSVSQMMEHPSFKRIVEMGFYIIPLLLEELQKEEHDFLFLALAEITCKNPVKEEHRGRVKEMAQDWLNWAKENGYLEDKEYPLVEKV